MNYHIETGNGYATFTSCEGVVQIDSRSPIVPVPELKPEDVLSFEAMDIGEAKGDCYWGYKADRTGGSSAVISVMKAVSRDTLEAYGYTEFVPGDFEREMFNVLNNAGGLSSAIKFKPVYRGLSLAVARFSDKASLSIGDIETQMDLDEPRR